MKLNEHRIWNERWRLAALSREELIKVGLVSIFIGMVYILYHFQGNTTDTKMFGQSAFSWLSLRWNESNGDFSHGWLIPFISLFVVYLNRFKIADAPKRVSTIGLMVVILGLTIHWMGTKSQHPRASLGALMIIIWGIPFYFYGWQVAKHLMFPAAYLIFAIPLNFLDAISFKLRMFVTVVDAALLNGLGVEVVQSGSRILAVNGSFALDIDDPCSGLRSLLAMTAITAVYAWFTQRTFIRKWILFMCSIPLAVLGNMIRVLAISLVAQAFGQDVAMIFHDYSGFIFFPVAIGLMLAVGGLLNMDLKAAWQNFKDKHLITEDGIDDGPQETTA